MTDDAAHANQLVRAIHTGDVAALRELLRVRPDSARRALGGAQGTRTPLHVACDWPGYFPNGPEITRVLLEAGAEPNARTAGQGFAETPLHWVASSDDVDVAETLIDGGADIESPDGSIGTPLDNAIGYGCWHVARLLVARGARVDRLWHAAALGDLRRVEELLTSDPTEVSHAFWQACAAGQRRTAETLLAAGADLQWRPDYAAGTTALDAAGGLSTRQQNVIGWLRDLGATSALL